MLSSDELILLIMQGSQGYLVFSGHGNKQMAEPLQKLSKKENHEL